MKNIAYLVFFVLGATVSAAAQNISTAKLSWSTTSVTDLMSNSTLSYQCTIKTNGNNSIDWVQGTKTYHYNVTQVIGSWTSIASDGSVVYKVSAGSKVSGQFSFSKSGTVIKVHLKTSTDGEADLDLEFTISGVQTI